MKEAIHHGDMVSFSCEGHFSNGEPIEPNQEKEIFKLIAGKSSRNLLQTKIATALVGMRVKDFKTLSMEKCFGTRDESLVVKVSLDTLPKGINENEQVSIELENSGQGQKQGIVKIIEEGTATIDFNHPLAGQDITFDIVILSFKKTFSRVRGR